MSRRSPDHLAPPGHELSALPGPPRRTRSSGTGWKSSSRSRSVPNTRSASQQNDDEESARPPSINVHGYDGTTSEVVSDQLDGIEEHTEDGSGVGDDHKQINAVGHSSLRRNVEESEYTLSDERSRRRIDSDHMSETDTIVPRRNLSVLDVAALIFNKMVISPEPMPAIHALMILILVRSEPESSPHLELCCFTPSRSQ